jgi:hypothetical protein
MGKMLSTSVNLEYIIFQIQVKMNNTKNEPSKSSSSSHVAEETSRAPHSRGSTLEDGRARNSEYSKAPPTSLETTSIGMETFRAHVSDTRNSTLEKIPEVNENTQVKESPKGFRRLLKFGKKNHNSATGHNVESDHANEIGANGSTNEGSVILSDVNI